MSKREREREKEREREREREHPLRHNEIQEWGIQIVNSSPNSQSNGISLIFKE